MGVNDIHDYEHFKLVPAFQSWIKTQPQLPQNIGKFVGEILMFSAET